MSIFRIVIIASKARLAAAGSGSLMASTRARGVICHERPHLSLHQPHSLSSPPLRTIAFHKRSFGLVIHLHAPSRAGPTRSIRIEGTNLERVPRLRYDAVPE